MHLYRLIPQGCLQQLSQESLPEVGNTTPCKHFCHHHPQACAGGTGTLSSISCLHWLLFSCLVWCSYDGTGVISPACSGVCPAVAAPGAELPLQWRVKLNTPLMGYVAVTEEQRAGTALRAGGENRCCYIKAVLQPWFPSAQRRFHQPD